jgi:thioredoxin-like negative regulator of GroEL
LCLLLLCWFASLGGAAWGQEVNWRQNYNAARREASEKGKPIVIDFGTESCFYCRKLDATTFRDPVIVSTLNEQFIPLKLNADREAALTEALRIERYPTIVMAAPDGKILNTQEGYVDAARFQEQLQRVLASVSNPEWMTRDYQEAAKAIAASDYARAIALLRSVTEDGKNRPVQMKALQLLQDLEQQAAGRLARARQMLDKGQSAEALDSITDLVKTFAGTQAAAEGGRLLTAQTASRPEIKDQNRVRRARELLAQAREDYRTQQYHTCLERCEVLAATYADTPEGSEGIQLGKEIKSNPDLLRQACETLSDKLGVLYLTLAESWLKKGQPQQAALYLERVIHAFPSSRQAEIAQLRLAQIQGQPTMSVDFKKP